MSFDISGYIHNNTGCYEKFTYPKSINKGRMTIVEVRHASLVEILSSLPIMGNECRRGDPIIWRLCGYC